MPFAEEFVTIQAPLKGLNIAKDWTQLDTNEASILRNVDFGRRRGVRMRNGVTVQQRFPTYTIEGSIREVVRAENGRRFIVAFAVSGGVTYLLRLDLQTQEWSSTGLGGTPGGTWDGAVLYNKLYFGNGINPVQVLDLSTLLVSQLLPVTGTVPNGNMFLEFKNRLVIANKTNLYCSAVALPDHWETGITGDNALDQVLGGRDGEEIMGLRKKSGVLKIFRSDGQVFSLDFLDNGLHTLQPDGVSLPCSSRYGIVQTENDIFTFGDDGVYSYGGQESYFGGDRPGEVSAPISPFWDKTHPNPEVGYALQNKHLAAGVYWRGNVIFGVCVEGSNANNHMLVYTPLPDGPSPWCEWTGISAHCFTLDTENDDLYVFSNEGGTGKALLFWDSASDDGTAIEYVWQTGKLQFSAPLRSTVKQVYVDCSMEPDHTANVVLFREDETLPIANVNSFPLKTETLPAVTSYSPVAMGVVGLEPVGSGGGGGVMELIDRDHRLPCFLKGRYFRIRLTVRDAGKRFEGYSLSILRTIRSVRSRKYDTAQYVTSSSS